MIRVKWILILSVSLLIIDDLKSQDTSLINNQYLLTQLDGNKFFNLFDFLSNQGELNLKEDSNVVLFHRKLIEDSLNLDIGIYVFWVLGSHQVPFLYFSYNNNKKFITNYSSDSLLCELIKFFEKNKKVLTEDLKIAYVEKISEFLGDRRLALKNRGFTTIIEDN